MTGEEKLRRGHTLFLEFGSGNDEALALFEQAAESGDLADHNRAIACTLLARCLQMRLRSGDAIVWLERAAGLTEHPSLLAEIHHFRGEALADLGRRDDAIAAFEQALASDRDHRYAPDSLAMLGSQRFYAGVEAGDASLIDSARDAFAESLVLLESDTGGAFETVHDRPKAIFDAMFGRGECERVSSQSNAKFAAIETFTQLEHHALASRDCITNEELGLLYSSWVDVLMQLDLEREARLVDERARRNLVAG